MFRAQVRRFVDAEIEPKVPEWNRVGMSDRASWRKMGEAGFLGANAPAEYGGGGVDFIYDAIVMEELSRVRAHGLMMSLHSDICMPYITQLRQRGAEAPLPAGCDQRRDNPRDRDDRAGHRIRSRRGADDSAPRRRPLCDQRIEDFYFQRADCRPGDRRVQDRPQGEPAAQGRQPDAGRRECAGIRARPQARQARTARAGHQRVVLRGLPRPGRESAR